MSAKPLAEVYEELKEHRRRGGSEEGAGQFPVQIFLSYRRADNPEVNRIFERLELLKDVPAGHYSSDEYLVRVIDIKVLADRIFGDEAKAEAWLERPNSGLSGQRPAELLKDELGAAVIREMLERIDHGIFA